MSSTTDYLCIRHPHITPSQWELIPFPLRFKELYLHAETFCTPRTTGTHQRSTDLWPPRYLCVADRVLRMRETRYCTCYTWVFMCVFACGSGLAVSCEPGWNWVMKIVLAVQDVSNYKQDYFPIQLKLTNWQEQLSSPPSGDITLW